MGTYYQKEIESLKEVKDLLDQLIEQATSKIQALENQVDELKRENRKLQIKINAYELQEKRTWDVVAVLRFRWFMQGEDDVCFEGEATVKLRGESSRADEYGVSIDEGDSYVFIRRCFKHDNGAIFTWNPYSRDYDKALTSALERAAIDAFYSPPSLAVVFPGEQE